MIIGSPSWLIAEVTGQASMGDFFPAAVQLSRGLNKTRPNARRLTEQIRRRIWSFGPQWAGARRNVQRVGTITGRRFNSKEGLFAEVIDHALDIRPLIEGDRSTLADRLARVVVYGRGDSADAQNIPLLLLLHSATEPSAAELLRSTIDRNVVRFIAERLEGPDAAVRAAMVTAQIVGFAILDRMLQPRTLKQGNREQLVTLLSKSLATCIG
jgi:Tetracyclin repressor-like, C-terminal domain